MRNRARDKVTPELRQHILERDQFCTAWRMDKSHICRDAFGTPHPPGNLDRLTLDHVHPHYGLMGRRAPSDARHLVALCAGANIGGPSKELREYERAYLAEVAA